MTAEKRSASYMTMAYTGSVAIVLYLASTVLGWPDFVRGLSVGLSLVSLAMLLRRKLRDEYIESLWNAGTATAFAALVVLFLAPFFEGFFDRVSGLDSHMDSPAPLAPAIAILGFFAGFHLKRLRSL